MRPDFLWCSHLFSGPRQPATQQAKLRAGSFYGGYSSYAARSSAGRWICHLHAASIYREESAGTTFFQSGPVPPRLENHPSAGLSFFHLAEAPSIRGQRTCMEKRRCSRLKSSSFLPWAPCLGSRRIITHGKNIDRHFLYVNSSHFNRQYPFAIGNIMSVA